MKEITALNFIADFRKKNIMKSWRNNASILKSPWGRPNTEFDCCILIENLNLLINGDTAEAVSWVLFQKYERKQDLFVESI
jgi:hypothetical protein